MASNEVAVGRKAPLLSALELPGRDLVYARGSESALRLRLVANIEGGICRDAGEQRCFAVDDDTFGFKGGETKGWLPQIDGYRAHTSA